MKNKHMKARYIVLSLGISALVGMIVLIFSAQPEPKNVVPVHFEQGTRSYHVMLDAQTAPLTTAPEKFLLQVHRSQPSQNVPEVTITMPMEGMVMKAPATIEKTTQGAFLVSTEFTMAGTWSFTVKPDRASEPVTFKIPVQ